MSAGGMSRSTSLAAMAACGAGTFLQRGMHGDYTKAAQPTWQLTTRLWFAALQCAGALLLSGAVLVLHGGARGALTPLRTQHRGLVLFVALSLVLHVLLREAALRYLSASASAQCEALVVLCMPLLAVAFEREASGAPRQYGIWPCLLRREARLRDPGWGVYPALGLLYTGAATAQWDGAVDAPAAGLAFGALSAISLGATLTAAANALPADASPLAPLALGWWVALLSAPALLLSSQLGGEGPVVSEFARAAAPAAALVDGWEAAFGGAALLGTLSVVHASSALSAAVLVVGAQTALKVANTLLAGNVGPANWLGLLLATSGIAAHACYLSLRAARRRALPAHALPAEGRADKGVDESSRLVRGPTAG